MITSGVPMAVVSKTLRHSTLTTTINIYGHLLKHAADEAVHALADALAHAEAHLDTGHPDRFGRAA
ncbi:hypothetical protein [Kitasatospora sp. NPDC004272]